MSAKNSTTRLEFRNDGFIILADGASTATIEWAQVREIVAYRRDPGEKDLLCLGFRIAIMDDYIEVDEETEGYQTLLKKIYEAFPSLKQKWWLEVTSSYGVNWTTIYGLSLAEQLRPAPAEQYLQRSKKKKQLARMGRVQALLLVAGVAGVGGVQMLLARWIAPWNNLVAVAAFPTFLVVLTSYFWCNPRTFFALLSGFYLMEFVWNFMTNSPGPCLLDKLIQGNFSYLLVLGVEILIGMGVMLLAVKRNTR